MVKSLSIVFGLTRELFSFVLIFYLLLFLLETASPGFVSGGIDLDIILKVVIFFGLLTPLGSINMDQENAETEGYPYYFTLIISAIVSGAIVYFLVPLVGTNRLLVSAICTLLIAAIGLSSFFEKKGKLAYEPIPEDIPIESSSKYLSRKAVIVISLVIPIISLLGYLFLKHFTRSATDHVRPTQELIPSKEPIFFEDTIESHKWAAQPMGQTVKIFNGGAEAGSAKKLASELLQRGYKQVYIGDLVGEKYENAIVSFRLEDKIQAIFIKRLLEDDYPVVLTVPSATTSAEISVILGKPTPISTGSGIIGTAK